MVSEPLLIDLSPEPILAAAESFRGAYIDLEHQRAIGPGALAAARQALQAELQRHGVTDGDRVIVAAGNGPGFIVALVSLLDRGAAPLLVHARTPAAELQRTANRFGAAFVLSDVHASDGLAAVSRRAVRLAAGGWLTMSLAEIDDFSADYCHDLPRLSAVPLHPTSGTTGQAKVALRPGLCAVAEAQHYIDTIGIDAGDTLLCVVPMSHAYGYGTCAMVPLLSGASVVTMGTFNDKSVATALREHAVTVFPAVPAMLDALLFGRGLRGDAVPRCVLSAGAPLPRRTALRFAERTGVGVRPLYGTTETGGISVAPAADKTRAAGWVGAPMLGVEARAEPSDHSHAAGDARRLSIRSSSMMAGYLAPGGIDTSPLDDGWFATGDLATIDSAGEIRLLGRETEVINVGGLKVVPLEVEEVIAHIDAVTEVKVYAGTNSSGAQFVKAAVAATAELDTARIAEHCKEHLVYYKCPTVVHLMERLPRSPAGKIVTAELP